MSKFITRIQLHKATGKDYEQLNTELQKASFFLRKTPAADKSTAGSNGEYNSRGYLTVKEVADAVYRAVKKTGLDYSFTILKDKRHYKLDAQ